METKHKHNAKGNYRHETCEVVPVYPKSLDYQFYHKLMAGYKYMYQIFLHKRSNDFSSFQVYIEGVTHMKN